MPYGCILSATREPETHPFTENNDFYNCATAGTTGPCWDVATLEWDLCRRGYRLLGSARRSGPGRGWPKISRGTGTSGKRQPASSLPAHAGNRQRGSSLRRGRWKVFRNTDVGRSAPEWKPEPAILRHHGRAGLACARVGPSPALRPDRRTSSRSDLRHADLRIFQAV